MKTVKQKKEWERTVNARLAKAQEKREKHERKVRKEKMKRMAKKALTTAKKYGPMLGKALKGFSKATMTGYKAPRKQIKTRTVPKRKGKKKRALKTRR